MTVLQKWRAGCVSPSVSSIAQIKSSGVIQWNEMELEKVSPWRCFSLSSNVIRAHNEGHGLDYNPPASLSLSTPFLTPLPPPPSLICLHHFSPSLTCRVPHLSHPINHPVSLSTSPVLCIGFNSVLSPSCSCLLTSFISIAPLGKNGFIFWWLVTENYYNWSNVGKKSAWLN